MYPISLGNISKDFPANSMKKNPTKNNNNKKKQD